jgi:hypothetical protein
MTLQSKSTDIVPTHVQGFLERNVPSFLRELVLGSARKDILAAIRRAPLEAWSISDDGNEIKLTTGPSEVTFACSGKKAKTVTAMTPHGPFCTEANDAACNSIVRRADRRLQGYALQLQVRAKEALSLLYETVALNKPLDWQSTKVDCFSLPTLSATTQSYECRIGNGLMARVKYEVFAGFISEEMAIESQHRYQQQVAMFTEAHRRYNSEMSQALYIGALYSSAPQLSMYVDRPPLQSGSFKVSTISLAVYNNELTHISQALGLSERIIYKHSADARKNSDLQKAWKHASGAVKN